ncbi:hypothetical protein CXG81DRAFT_12595 [Caulochytrium protostelioides]|uniref:Ribosomal protein S2 n=1 Tax=Caulochytrium protostelioides TaxID=1555241 RepID=A0A4P9X6Y4_9FUNG|nr:hypothetical protein CXG81DRAFT_12595 [Caulochytrium protostelioides]|eukprot:RKP00955.1 hypothetical protein CXG81DRAFT_12595 [Caulochytrium protostelioides]
MAPPWPRASGAAGSSEAPSRLLVGATSPAALAQAVLSPVPVSTKPLTLETLLAAGVHFGHDAAQLHPYMMPHAFGTRDGITILHLESTLRALRRSIGLARDIAARGGNVLFLGTRMGIHSVTYEAAREAGAYCMLHWRAGLFTNRERVLKRSSGFDPNRPYVHIPDLLIVLDMPNNIEAVKEANKANVPTIAIVDSNMDPRLVHYPIPGNDDSVASVHLIAGLLARAVKEGKAIRKQMFDLPAS